jgi:histidine triad (HIT) family protein
MASKAGPLHQRGGARGFAKATVYVSGWSEREDVKIFSVPDCLFCGIAAGEVPATIVSERRRTIAFADINPQAPVHILLIPRAHHANLQELAASEEDGLLLELLTHATEVAREHGISDGGFRVVFNTGSDGGQTVEHVHAHLLGGRQMTWPPG